MFLEESILTCSKFHSLFLLGVYIGQGFLGKDNEQRKEKPPPRGDLNIKQHGLGLGDKQDYTKFKSK